MKLITLSYISIYFGYVIFGPHFISRFFKNDKLDISNNITDLIKRMFFLSYIALLYNAYYFYNPSLESFYNAIIINIISILGFVIKWYHLRDKDPYYYSGILMHILVIVPLLISIFYINLSHNPKFNIQSKFTILFLLSYGLIFNKIYKSIVL